MNKLKYKLYYFMQGRRGMDYLGRFLMNTALLLLILTMFLGRFKGVAVFLNFITMAILLYANFRIFSRNLYKRELENSKYLAWREMIRQKKFFKYFKCPKCGQKMRAPKGKGRIKVTCHHCNTTFEKKV